MYEVEWEKYPLEDYPVVRPLFDSIGILQHTTSKDFVTDLAIEDHKLNCQDDYEVRIRDYYRMDLALLEKFLKL